MFELRGKAAVIAGVAVLVLAATSGARANSERVLYSFTGSLFGGITGGNPAASLIMDVSGNLYGTTPFGGAVVAGGGVVFRVSPRGEKPCCTVSPAATMASSLRPV